MATQALTAMRSLLQAPQDTLQASLPKCLSAPLSHLQVCPGSPSNDMRACKVTFQHLLVVICRNEEMIRWPCSHLHLNCEDLEYVSNQCFMLLWHASHPTSSVERLVPPAHPSSAIEQELRFKS
eukprot:1173974-Amphidinium_carterae.1